MSRLHDSRGEPVEAPLERAAQTLTDPFRDFISAQSASGWVLLGATAIALVLANSALAPHYFALLHLELGIVVAGHAPSMSLQHWVNDGLMAVFFFLLGLELKRELLVGQLSDLRRASSVLCGAFGGMLMPALLFLAVTGPDARDGWAIPVATDTAFAIMLLVLLGTRVPAAARAFLVGLAIVDDIGAILIIALAYTADFDAALFLPAAASLAVLVLLNLAGVRSGLPYLVGGAVLWYLFLQMGLHGTLTGVVVACTAPVRPSISRDRFTEVIEQKLQRFEDQHEEGTDTILEQPEQQKIAHELATAASRASVPLKRWELLLDRPVSFVVMPVFAFLNAGIELSASALLRAWTSDLSLGILLGLLLGKPLGIVLGVRIGKSLGVADLPAQLNWRHLAGIGMLGGIGFTMSLFIATLGFGAGTQMLETAKQGVIGTSLCAGLLGYAWLRWGCGAAGRRHA